MKPENQFNVTGPLIQHLRKQCGWTQQKLAERLRAAGWKISRSSLAKIECRIVRVADFELLYFARVFGIGIRKLFPRESIKDPVRAMIAKADGRPWFSASKTTGVTVTHDGKVKR